MSKAIAVEEAFNGVGRSRSRVIEDSTDFTQFHPLDVRGKLDPRHRDLSRLEGGPFIL